MYYSKSLLKRAAVFGALLAFAAPALHARLYEDQRALISRYGKPQKLLVTNQLGKGITFRKNGIRTSVLLIGGRAHHISFISGRGNWPEEQIATVLSTNSNGASWKRVSPTHWERSDGHAMADLSGVRMTIYTDQYVVTRRNLGSRDGTEAHPARMLVTPSTQLANTKAAIDETVKTEIVKTGKRSKKVTVTRTVIPLKEAKDKVPPFVTIDRAKQ